MSRDAKQVLTVSRLKNFNRCKRSHQLSYVDLIDTAKTSASLAIGTAIHKGLEVYLWTKDLSRAISAMKKSADLPPYLEAEVICLLTCYIKNYENDGIEILAVELEFSMPLINPDTQRPSRKYTLGGKIDAIVKLPNGEIWLMEHKSTTFSIGIGDPYWDKLILDEQISLYIPAARHYGYEVQGCIQDVIRRPTIKPALATPPEKRKYKKAKNAAGESIKGDLFANQRLTDETAEEYLERCVEHVTSNMSRHFRRMNIIRFDSELINFRRDLWQTAQQMTEAANMGQAPRNSQSCFHFSRPCKFFPLCTGQSDVGDPKWIKKDRPHQELGEQENGTEGHQESKSKTIDEVCDLWARGSGQEHSGHGSTKSTIY